MTLTAQRCWQRGGQERLELHLRMTAMAIVWLQSNLDVAAVLGDSGVLAVGSHTLVQEGESCPCV